MLKKQEILIQGEKEYELIDPGLGEKLERFGSFVLRRPDPQALWQKQKDSSLWENADGYFETSHTGGKWIFKNLPEEWNATIADITFELSRSTFKHVGIFPEQIENWKWIREKIKNEQRNIRVLNLFGYTGGATIACLQAGAEVVHVDSSKTAITQANRNAVLSGVDQKPVRWIPDDVRKFLEREIKRNVVYDAVIMDPPAFGHGSKKEIWKIEEDLLPLLQLVKKVLSQKPLFIVLNGYASGYSSVTYAQNLTQFVAKYGGTITHGELLIVEKDTDRLLPAGISARWSNQ